MDSNRDCVGAKGWFSAADGSYDRNSTLRDVAYHQIFVEMLKGVRRTPTKVIAVTDHHRAHTICIGHLHCARLCCG